MAREGRGRRGEDAGADTGRGRAERPARVPQGPSFAITVAFASGLGAALLAFVGAFAVGSATATDPGAALDNAGVQAARLLAAPGIDRWSREFGSTAGVRARAKDYLDAKLAAIKDERERTPIQKAVDEFRAGKPSIGPDWKPGFDHIFPPNDPADTLRKPPSELIKAVPTGPDGLLGAAVKSPGGSAVAVVGEVYEAQGSPRMVGDTRVFVFTSARQYEHPIKDAQGVVQGTAVVALANTAKASSPVAAAGAAAGAAFLGAFLLGLVTALAPVKAIRKLAQDTEAIAAGDLSARVAVGGPDVVQAVAKNVQRIVHVASSAAAAVPAEPQVVQQQVFVQPVAEVQEALAPVKAFRRPDELEIEATHKPSPDLGNDYHDVINVDDRNVGVFVADIPNQRGVRGAMYMAQVRALFRASAVNETSPAEVLKKLNRAFAIDLPRGIYVTAMYAVVDVQSGLCKVASAQHLPLVIWKLSKKASARLAPEGIALGLDPGPVFDKTIVEKAIQLERGDRIVLYTDGAINARSAAGAQYGEERFYYVVNREAPKNSAACVNFVANDVDLFHEGAPQTDDFTIVTLRKMK